MQRSADNIEVTLGEGVQGTINAQTFRIGKPAFAQQILKNNTAINAPSDKGHWLLLCSEEQIIAWFSISDTLRDDSHYCIEQLKRNNIKVHMLTGDNSDNATIIAKELAIEHLKTDASPSDKIRLH